MSLADEPPIRDVADRAIRVSLQHPKHLRSFLQVAVPELADRFDCERARFLERDFVLEDWRGREADVPIEIPFLLADENDEEQTETDALIFLLIEHQTATDRLMPLRMLVYTVLYWERQWSRWERLPSPKEPFQLRPVLPLVLYTGDRPWGSAMELSELFAPPEQLHQFGPVWSPVFWNLSDQTAEQLLQSGEHWLQTLAVIRTEREDAETFRNVFAVLMQQLVSLHGTDKVEWTQLMEIALAWVYWKRPDTEQNDLVNIAEQSNQEAVYQQELKQMSANLGPTLVEKSIEKGIQLGGATVCRKLLLDYLEARFHAVPDELREAAEACDDPEVLQQVTSRAYRSERLEDIQFPPEPNDEEQTDSPSAS